MANASERKDIRKAEKAGRIAEQQRREVVASIMSTMAGRSWMWERMAACNCFSTTHIAGAPDASAYQEGRRSAGLDLLNDLMAHCPDLFIQAMREQNERHIQSNIDAATADTDAERRGSPLADGGDSGAEPDSDADTADPEAGPGWNPGRSVYTEAPGTQ